MNYDEILRKIIRKYGIETDNIRITQIIESKLKKHTATYADAGKYAQEIGKALTEAFREYLPEALTDGMLYRAAAEVLVDQPMKIAGKDIAKVAADIQRELNEDAGIGINPIIPEMNQDQIDGIITGICNADSYEAGEDTLMARVGNCLEGYVDDFVRENADFQYKAGLSPTIERKTDGKCCKWCSSLAGNYLYSEVNDNGNDVFRRHKNCHCMILYNPRDGSKRRQDVHSKDWGTEEELRERQMHYSQKQDFEHDFKRIKARKVDNFSENNLFVDQNVSLTPRQIRRINTQITQAKELHGLIGKCDSPFVIVNDNATLAAYNPRTNTFFISSIMANEKDILKLQKDFVCPRDSRSTMTHELFHWKDADDYRKNVGTISDASAKSTYTQYQQRKAFEELKKAGINTQDISRIRTEISDYAAEKLLDNNFEEVYTEWRTLRLILGGG